MSKVLVVDDSKAIRDLLSSMVSLLGFDVAVASNGNEALHLFLTNSFDFVLTDVQMPGMDGWTLAFHVKDKSPDTPCSGNGRGEKLHYGKVERQLR